MELLTRLLLALAIIALGALAYCAWNRLALFRLKRRARKPGTDRLRDLGHGYRPVEFPDRAVGKANVRHNSEFGAFERTHRAPFNARSQDRT